MSPTVTVQGEEGGAVVFLHSPESVLLGVDFTVWKPPENNDVFVISGILAGTHYISWQNVEGNKEGCFAWLTRRQVVVFEWHSKDELFKPVRDEAEVFRYQRGHDNLSLLHKAVAFPQSHDSVEKWQSLTYAINPAAINALQESLEIFWKSELREESITIEEVDLDEYKLREKELDTELSPEIAKTEYLELDWTDLPQKPKSMDTSPQLEKWIANCGSRVNNKDEGYNVRVLQALESNLNIDRSQLMWLAEMQIAYIHFVLGASLDAFYRWKEYLIITPKADCLFDSLSSLGCLWISLLGSQLKLMPHDLLESDITRNNFIIGAVLDVLEYTEDHENPLIRRCATQLEVSKGM